eukprot:738741-Rhodomonas_salina.1
MLATITVRVLPPSESCQSPGPTHLESHRHVRGDVESHARAFKLRGCESVGTSSRPEEQRGERERDGCRGEREGRGPRGRGREGERRDA